MNYLKIKSYIIELFKQGIKCFDQTKWFILNWKILNPARAIKSFIPSDLKFSTEEQVLF